MYMSSPNKHGADTFALDVDTAGGVAVHVASNPRGNSMQLANWLDYAVGWLDGGWHHVAVTWAEATGEVSFYFDGQLQVK